MLKDRRVLLEQEIAKLTKECGKLYFDAVMDNNAGIRPGYDLSIDRLSKLTTELMVINQMIADGHP